MYPHHYHWRHMGYHCGPSRLLWFVIGAGAATWWHKHREMNNNWGYWGHCRRAPIQETLPNRERPLTDVSSANSNVKDSESSFSFKDIPRTINNIPPASWGWGERKEVERYQEQQDHLADLRKQATETMSDMTEATLDTLLSAVETLRTKLVESREQRQKQEEKLRRDIEEQAKNPPRLV